MMNPVLIDLEFTHFARRYLFGFIFLFLFLLPGYLHCLLGLFSICKRAQLLLMMKLCQTVDLGLIVLSWVGELDTLRYVLFLIRGVRGFSSQIWNLALIG